VKVKTKVKTEFNSLLRHIKSGKRRLGFFRRCSQPFYENRRDSVALARQTSENQNRVRMGSSSRPARTSGPCLPNTMLLGARVVISCFFVRDACAPVMCGGVGFRA
jgi:hypothetical protein